MPDTSSPTLTERQQFWLEHLRTCEAEGKATVVYAREHGLSPSGMYSARQDLVHRGVLPAPGKPRFARARVAPPQPEAQWQVQLPNGAVVSFNGDVHRDMLTTILQAAASLA